MKTNQRTAKKRQFDKNRMEKIERNKKKRLTAQRAAKIAAKEEENAK